MKKLNSILTEISSILSDGLYHDGDTIGKKLNVTRSAVWKVIKKLEDYDLTGCATTIPIALSSSAL